MASPSNDMAPPAQGDLRIGERLRLMREQAGLSQRELAKRSGVTNTTISLIEQDRHAPSVMSLHRILAAIPMSLADFFALPDSNDNALFCRNEEMTLILRGDADVRCMATQRRGKKLQMFVERYKIGAGTDVEMIASDGETAAIVMQGLVRIILPNQVQDIEAGGGFHLFGTIKYRIENIGTELAIVVCAVTPPLF